MLAYIGSYNNDHVLHIATVQLIMAVNSNNVSSEQYVYLFIIPTQCFYCFFGDFDWSVGNIKLFLHFDKNPCVGIFDNCLDFTVLDCVDNNETVQKTILLLPD